VSFATILELPEGPERTLALVAWFQALYESQPAPILVGGGAVELYTGGAYQTGDLDFVGSVPAKVAAELEEAGFRKQAHHWLHEDGEVSAWQFWGSERDAANAFQIWQSTDIDEKRAHERSEDAGVLKSFQSLIRFRKLLAAADPSREQLSDWARTRP
jgi:hypothetical protein